MPRPLPSLAAAEWTAELALRLERAASALARLDARIGSSPLAEIWLRRAAWGGLARLLQAQGEEIEEIDIAAAESGVVLAHRHVATHRVAVVDALAGLREALARTDDLGALAPPSPAPPDDAPALLRALAAAAAHARAHHGTTGWTALPLALARLKLTHRPLALFAGGVKAWRHAPREREAIIRRYLKAIVKTADDGLDLLAGLERFRTRCAAALAREARPGALRPLAALLIDRPFVAPLAVADALGLTISGAGRLLVRAAALGLVHEITGRETWKLYLASDLAFRYGFASRPRGRPPSPAPALAPLDHALARFDREMAEVDAKLRSLGVLPQEDD